MGRVHGAAWGLVMLAMAATIVWCGCSRDVETETARTEPPAPEMEVTEVAAGEEVVGEGPVERRSVAIQIDLLGRGSGTLRLRVAEQSDGMRFTDVHRYVMQVGGERVQRSVNRSTDRTALEYDFRNRGNFGRLQRGEGSLHLSLENGDDPYVWRAGSGPLTIDQPELIACTCAYEEEGRITNLFRFDMVETAGLHYDPLPEPADPLIRAVEAEISRELARHMDPCPPVSVDWVKLIPDSGIGIAAWIDSDEVIGTEPWIEVISVRGDTVAYVDHISFDADPGEDDVRPLKKRWVSSEQIRWLLSSQDIDKTRRDVYRYGE